ncbi:hypothetical protein M8J75_009138 [Diaphorina citri]|nr:hypothetical protein M8J75_009138 [Diaphorina citri]
MATYWQAYGKVFLVRKKGGVDNGRLYAMKVLKKATIVQKKKTTEHTKTERQVLEAVRQSPFLVTLHYAFQTDAKLHLILDYVSGGELFTHLYQRNNFTEEEVRIYIGEIILALEHLHKKSKVFLRLSRDSNQGLQYSKLVVTTRNVDSYVITRLLDSLKSKVFGAITKSALSDGQTKIGRSAILEDILVGT